MFTLAISTMYGIWTVLYRSGVTGRPGKTLSDVNILEVSIGGSQHLQYSA